MKISKSFKWSFLIALPIIILLGYQLEKIFNKEIVKAKMSDKYNIFFTCDVDGRIEPCGCFSGQMGGLTKIKTMIDESNTTNKLIFDVGDASIAWFS